MSQGSYGPGAMGGDPDFSLLSSGTPQITSVVWGGLVYAGEVLLADDWDPQWGQPLTGETYFRVVLLRHPHRIASAQIKDSRVAVCLPGSQVTEAWENAQRELRQVREARTAYFSRRDPYSLQMRRSLEQEEARLERQLLGEEAVRFRSGRVLTAADVTLRPEEVFAQGDLVAGVGAIALALLAHTYPTLPLNAALLPHPLIPQDARQVFQAIVGPLEAGPRAALAALGPALGLSLPEEPAVFRPVRCPVFDIIRTQMGGSNNVSWEEVQYLLAHTNGLTIPFARLFLAAFVYDATQEAGLRLVPGHGLKLKDGSLVVGDRLTREMLPLVDWDGDWHLKVARVERAQEITWDDALPYAKVLWEDARPARSLEDAKAQEQDLLEWVRSLAQGLPRASSLLKALGSALESPSSQEMEGALQRLDHVLSSSNIQELVRRAREDFGDPASLSRALQLLGQLLRMGDAFSEATQIRSYLDEAFIGVGYDDLALARDALLMQLNPVSLWQGLQGWSGVKAAFQQFQARYSRAYVQYHSYAQREMLPLWAALDRARLSLDALGRLNSLPELGPPVRQDLPRVFSSLVARIRLCATSPSDLSLEQYPRCRECGLGLGDMLPHREVDIFLKDLEDAIAEQNRRLSHILVRRILRGQADQRLDDLLKIVQASDLSALVTTLDDELLAFIKEFLASP